MTLIQAELGVLSGDLVEGAWVEVTDDRIAAVGSGSPPAEPDVLVTGAVLPGFIDQHCHGGAGSNFFAADAAEAQHAADLHLSHGTTTLVASLVTAAPDPLLQQVSALVPLVKKQVLAGIHLEGPWISELMCGAHDPELLRDPDPAEVSRLLAAGGGTILMATIAPERAGAMAAIRQLVAAGVVAAVGHTACDYTQAEEAIAAGATVATHLFNRMPPISHRDPGPIVALMGDPRVSVELIADGVHLDPSLIEVVVQAVGCERAAVITDAMAAAGSPDGDYVIGELEVEVIDGVARLRDGGALAGSSLTMDAALRVLVIECGVELAEASTMLSGASARALGLADRGVLQRDHRADLVVVDDDLAVTAVMQAGTWVRGGESQ